MQNLYIIRHGQANFAGGTENYDRLSNLGKEQALLLTKYVQQNKIYPDWILLGELQRHKETAEPLLQLFEISEEKMYRTSGLNEFTPSLWKNLAKLVSTTNFNLQKELILLEKKKNSDPKKIAFLFFKITETILRAWKEGATPEGEISYQEFKIGISKIKELILENKKAKQIFVFSSGTPISIFLSLLLEMKSTNEMDWMYSLWNTSVSHFRRTSENWKPVTINSLPHISDLAKRSIV